ncbi:MAG: Maf family protein [candidate division KSB1 bacterium]|nr:Maf family protein [candidate division KSB1 bacterium]MDZ7335081.1 Maf family protein [candidate division KSB1 bacterium]MDZ7356250.1 Maf family protein [candidate division KSB1 bacterium]MDZ7375072.1 Maf family protein [candidate division KSB1 bacterium]MDZ7400055.1 Maf family protein [candidate division KSB1 bacterium]
MPILNPVTKRIVLASQSPRRIELLKKVIPTFEICATHFDEPMPEIFSPEQLVMSISMHKAAATAQQIDSGVVIGADSIVVLDGKILGKPQDRKESYQMLSSLSGRVHRVYTGFSIISVPEQRSISDYEVTEVKFRQLEPWEIEAYIESGQPFDKAGAYGIQDDAAIFVESITGDYYNVVGLPLTKLFLALRTILNGEGKN